MDVWKAIATIGRRWYVSIPVLALCIAASLTLVDKVDATYSSEASVILLQPVLEKPKDAQTETLVNPFLGAGLPLAANAVASAATSDRVADKLKDAGLETVKFEVFSGDQTPIIYMKVESNDQAKTAAAMPIVVGAVQQITFDLQVEAEAPETQFITAQVLAPEPAQPFESLASKTKVAMAMAIVTLLAVVCISLLADRILLARDARRARRLRSHAAEGDEDSWTEDRLHEDEAAEAASSGADEDDHQPVRAGATRSATNGSAVRDGNEPIRTNRRTRQRIKAGR